MESYKLRNILERMRVLDAAMPLSALETFVWVAMNEGMHQYDLEVFLGCSNATASRSINWWSDWKSFKDKKKGPGYIESYPDPADKRYRVVRLTPKGRAFWNSIMGDEGDDRIKE